MKKALQTLLVLGIIGVIAYKAYQYFIQVKDDDVVDGDIVDEFDDLDDYEVEEESLAEKIRAAAKKVIAK